MTQPNLPDDLEERLQSALQQRGYRAEAPIGIPIGNKTGSYPALPAARRFWLEEELDDTPGLNVLCCMIQLPYAITLDDISICLTNLSQSVETLRTIFYWRNDDVFAEPLPSVQPIIKVLTCEENIQDHSLKDLKSLQMGAPKPPWRLIAQIQDGHIKTFILQIHHALMDWSGINIFVSLLWNNLLGKNHHGALAPSTANPSDAGRWWVARQSNFDVDTKYWRIRLKHLPQPPKLVSSQAKPPKNTGVICNSLPIPPDLKDRICALAAERQTTPFTLLLGLYAMTLQRFTGADCLTIGTTISNREIPGAERIVGCLADLAPIRLDLQGNPNLVTVLNQNKTSLVQDLGHAQIGYERLKSAVSKDVTAPEGPLFNHLFGMIATDKDQNNDVIRPLPSLTPRAEIALDIFDDGYRWTALFEFKLGSIHPAVANAFSNGFLSLAAAAVLSPNTRNNRLSLMRFSSDETGQTQWQKPGQTPPKDNLSDWLRSTLEDHRKSPLILTKKHWLTGEDLLHRAGILANQILALGIQPGALIAICLPRDVELIPALIATIQTGGTFLLLDPSHPSDRNNQILEDCKPALVIAEPIATLTAAIQASRLSPHIDLTAPSSSIWTKRPAGSAAYLVYTSGSTGRPKGVLGREEGLLLRLSWGITAFPALNTDRACLKTSPVFVDFLTELFQPLLAGIPLVIADTETAHTPDLLAELISAEKITRITLVPTLLRALLEAEKENAQSLSSLRICFSSGEPLSPTLAKRFTQILPNTSLVNLYGSSEVSGDVSAAVFSSSNYPINVGQPLPGAGVWLVDSLGEHVPQGAIGEILVTGPYVAHGYLNGDNDSRFSMQGSINSKNPQFLTGDLGYWIKDSGIFLLGRHDRQVKIEGVRIDCAEVEQAILNHPAITEAHVTPITRKLAATTPQLWAYIVAAIPIDAASLRTWLKAKLPRAALPAGLTQLSSLPVGPTGKLDKSALPLPNYEDDNPIDKLSSSISPNHQWIADLWQSVLGCPVDHDDVDFFRLGGASLDAIRLTHRLATKSNRPVPVSLLFDNPTLSTFAEALALVDSSHIDEPLQALEITEDTNTQSLATPNQMWLWNSFKSDPTSPAFNLQLGYLLEGEIDPSKIDHALIMLIKRHIGLRIVLNECNAQLIQSVQAEPTSLLTVEHLSGGSITLDDRMAELAKIPFDLSQDMPIRAHLLIESRQRSTLCLVLHHVAADGWSGQILVRDLSYILENEGTPAETRAGLSPLVYANKFPKRTPQLLSLVPAYLKTLENAQAPRPTGMLHVDRTQAIDAIKIDIPPSLNSTLSWMAHKNGVTLYQIAVTIWCVLLTRLTGIERPLVNVVQSGRENPEIAETVGFFANTTLIAPNFSHDPTLQKALDATRSSLKQALSFQDIPLSWVQSVGYMIDGSLSSGLSCFVLEQSLTAWHLKVPNCNSKLIFPPTSPAARADLALILNHEKNQTLWMLEYASSRIPKSLATQIAQGLSQLASAITHSIEAPISHLKLSSVTAPISFLSCPPIHTHELRIEQILLRQKSIKTEAKAIIDLNQSWTFYDLNAHVENLSRALSRQGYNADSRIAVSLAPSADQIALLLAIWTIGATAILLDPAWPQARRIQALDISRATVVIANVLELEQTSSADTNFGLKKSPSSVAAVIFTSGTTGRPKAIELEHAALCRLGVALCNLYDLTPQDRILQTVSPAFDVALSDLVMSLVAGATLIVTPRSAVMPGRNLTDTIRQNEATVMQATAALINATDPISLPSLRLIAVGGEAIGRHARQAWSSGRRVLTIYGPSETTVSVCAADLTENSPEGFIGWPIAGAQLAIVDENLIPLPLGYPGELLIGGESVSLGYTELHVDASKRFLDGTNLPLDFPSNQARWYRSGDRAVLLENKGLVFLGRIDRQLKVRGNRVEPMEIESLLERMPGIMQAFVDLITLESEETPVLCAWVRTLPDSTETVAENAIAELRLLVPEAFVPSRIVTISAFPLNINGKIDSSALPHPKRIKPRSHDTEQTSADVQIVVASAWRDLLQTDAELDGVAFFEAGGHSLLIVRLQQLLEHRFDIQIPIAEFFAAPTISAMTEMIRRRLDLPNSPISKETSSEEEFLI